MSWLGAEPVYNFDVSNSITDLLDGMQAVGSYGLVISSSGPPTYSINLKMVEIDGYSAINRHELVEDLLALGMEADTKTHAPKYYVFIHRPDTGPYMEVTYKVTLRFIYGYLTAEFNIWKFTPR